MSRAGGGLTRAQWLRAAGATALAGLGIRAVPARQAQTGAVPTMNTRPIPATGEALPVIGCGTWLGFDHRPGSAEYQRLSGVLRALFAAGGRVIDSSPMYGRSEETTGELLADAKKTPDKLRYMSTGPLGPLHVAMEYLGKLSGAQMIHAPYKGEAPALPDLLQQRVDMGMMTALFTRPQVQSGKLRVLATLSAQRMASWPEIPTVAELGYPGYAAPIWNGFFVPRKTGADVIDRLGRTTVAQLQAPALKNLLEKQGVSVTAQGPDAYEMSLQAKHLRWQQMIRESQVLTKS